MILKSTLLNCIKKLRANYTLIFRTDKQSTCIRIMGVSFIEFVRHKINFFDKKQDKIEKYWNNLSVKEVIETADQSFEQKQYMEIYETLNRIKYSKDTEVVWRLARALYNLSLMPNLSHDVKKQMIEEAYEVLEKTAQTGIDEGSYHKWMAVILNRKNALESLDAKIRGYPKIRDCLAHACSNDPKDFTVHYMLGRWHYELANLTWLQRQIAKYLFTEPPRSTFEEAYKYLRKAEELNPRSFLPNIYLLGCVCMKLNQYYRAQYYLQLALTLPARNDYEKCCASHAKILLEKLQMYDLGSDLLYQNNNMFGFDH